MFTGTLVVDLLLGDVHSLKEKRGLVRPLIADVRRQFAVSVAEVGDADVHRRAQIGIAVVSGEPRHIRDVVDACERYIAGRPEFELLSAQRALFGDDEGLREVSGDD